MSFLFTPQIIDFHRVTLRDSVSLERENILVETPMDKGVHTRWQGSATVKKLMMTIRVSAEELSAFNALFDIPRAVFYSTFPDQEYAGVENGKYYAFSFAKYDFEENIVRKGVYDLDLELYWHFRKKGIDRV